MRLVELAFLGMGNGWVSRTPDARGMAITCLWLRGVPGRRLWLASLRHVLSSAVAVFAGAATATKASEDKAPELVWRPAPGVPGRHLTD